jgi:tRNA isopentenyl-2-thiomethyl-A-37 hydroxylase MiaE
MVRVVLIRILSVALFTSNAMAFAVEDFGAYTRMAQQITVLRDQLSQAEKVATQAEKMGRYVEDIGGYASAVKSKISQYRNQTQRISRTIDSVKKLPNGKELDFKKIEDIGKAIDIVYVPPSRDPYGKKYEAGKKQDRQEKLKDSMVYAKYILENSEGNFKNLESLSNKLARAKHATEVHELTGAILASQAEAILRIERLLAHFTESLTSLRFEGVDDNEKGKVMSDSDWKTYLYGSKTNTTSNIIGRGLQFKCNDFQRRRGTC